eukprot:gene4503-6363_t
MKLLPITAEDLSLYIAMFCDPIQMKDLGGAQNPEQASSTLNKQIAYQNSGKGWVYKIIPTEEELEGRDIQIDDEFNGAVGTVCIWDGYWDEKDQPISELGYGIVRKFHSNGFATKAIRLLLEKCYSEEPNRWGELHAFTATENSSSNKLLERSGFELIGISDVDYSGSLLHCNHWKINTNVNAK